MFQQIVSGLKLRTIPHPHWSSEALFKGSLDMNADEIHDWWSILFMLIGNFASKPARHVDRIPAIAKKCLTGA